jgi:hypothetical protein
MHWPPLALRNYSWYSFLLGAESPPGPLCGRKEYVVTYWLLKTKATQKKKVVLKHTISLVQIYFLNNCCECFSTG